MKVAAHIATIGAAFVVCACAHGAHPENDPVALAALRADVRLVDGETTWVTHGAGYELAGRTRGDLVAVQPELDREAAVFRRVFPSDSLTIVVATVRRAPDERKPYVPAAPVPVAERTGAVELVLPDPKAGRGRDDDRGGPGARVGAFGERNSTLPVVRAWLSAHASALTKQPAPFAQTNGQADDPRVPAWAAEMIPLLSADSLVDPLTTTLAAHAADLIPLSEYLTMERPPIASPAVARRGGGEGTPSGRGGTRGGMGGMGGRGGMGRRGEMGGRGEMNRGGDRAQMQEMMPLQGAALFAAQSVVFGRYLSREGFDVIGAIVDAQIRKQSIDDALAKRNALTVEEMETDWRRWLMERAAAVSRR